MSRKPGALVLFGSTTAGAESIDSGRVEGLTKVEQEEGIEMRATDSRAPTISNELMIHGGVSRSLERSR
jgi:hypothetical protein